MYAIDLHRPREERRTPREPGERRDLLGVYTVLSTLVGAGVIGWKIPDWIAYILDRESYWYRRAEEARAMLDEAETELAKLEEAKRLAESSRHLEDDDSSDSSWF